MLKTLWFTNKLWYSWDSCFCLPTIMKITICIPTFNEEKYISQTILSLQKLHRKPDEIIIIDGGSTDKTVEIARKAGAKALIFPRRGIGYARQQGLKAATGDLVAYTDADTEVPADWLDKIEETLSRPGVVGTFGIFQVPSGWWPYRWFINYLQPILNRIYYWFGIPMAPGQNIAFIRKVGLECGGFPEDFKIAEDIEMARRLMTKGKVIMRSDNIVISSGRRGNEGTNLFSRPVKAFLLYFIFRKANKIGFPDMR